MSAEPFHTLHVPPDSTRMRGSPYGLMVLLGILLGGVGYQVWLNWEDWTTPDPVVEIRDITYGTNPRVWTISARVDPRTADDLETGALSARVRIQAYQPLRPGQHTPFQIPSDWGAKPGWVPARFSGGKRIGNLMTSELWLDPPLETLIHRAPVAYNVMIRLQAPDGTVVGRVHERFFADRRPEGESIEFFRVKVVK